MIGMADAYYPLDIFLDNPAYGFVVSFILNAVYFAIIGYVLIRPALRKADFHRFFIGMLGMTVGTVAAGFVPFYAFGISGGASYLPHFMASFVLLAGINFLLARYHFGAPAARSAAVAAIMAVLTNSYLVWVVFGS